MSDEEIKNPICEQCGFTASPDEFDASISLYHDLKCPICYTTNIDWDYGGYKHNNLDTSKLDEYMGVVNKNECYVRKRIGMK